MTSNYIKKIESSHVYDVAQVSPLEVATCLSDSLSNRVLLKREDMQQVFSFKLRGAYNKIMSLSDAQKKKGVIAASAGNHAQGVALAGEKLGIYTLIVMPCTSPQIKVKAVRQRGAEVILKGDTYDQAYQHALRLSQSKALTFIHPYDDPEVIAGQGTIAKEIHEQCTENIHAVFIPVGGGGLIAGMAVYLKHYRPQTKIIGVEPEDAPTLYTAMKHGKRVELDSVGLFADGVAVSQIGAETFAVARDLVDEVILVTTDEICAAIKDNFDDTRTLAEPAGALSIAGMKKYVARQGCHDETLISIISGANVNFDRLKHIVERYEIGANTESLFAVTIPERPRSFLEFCRLIGKHTITEFNYRYSSTIDAHVFVGLQFSDASVEQQFVVSKLEEGGYAVFDISDNEMAKLHVRHMVGGRALQLTNEKLLRFQFPERPSALLEFLETMQRDWNITLFHYRNHGAAYGRVLVGMQIPDSEMDDLQKLIKKLDYRFCDETDNMAYRLFLK